MSEEERPRGVRRAVAVVSAGLDVVQRVLIVIVTALIATSALLLFWQVTDRLVFSGGQNWIEEYARLSLIWMTFLGAAALIRQRRHLAVDYLADKLPETWRRILAVLVDLLLLALMVVLLSYAAPVLEGAAALRSPSLGIPRSVLVLAAVVSFGITAVYCLEAIVRSALRMGPPRGFGAGDDVPIVGDNPTAGTTTTLG